jgi:hypothetical protein
LTTTTVVVAVPDSPPTIDSVDASAVVRAAIETPIR